MAPRSPRNSGAPVKGAPKAVPPMRRAASGEESRQGRQPFLRTFMSRGFQLCLIAALVLAPLLALGIQLARAPDDVPSVVSLVKPRTLGSLIAGSLANPQPTNLEFSLEEINAHLALVLSPVSKKDGGWSFQTAAFRLEAERVHLHTVYRWHGLDLHLRVSYMVALQGGKLQVRPFSASFGRVHLGLYWIRKMEEGVLHKLLPSLKKEQILMNRLETLRLESGRALLKVRASSGAQSN